MSLIINFTFMLCLTFHTVNVNAQQKIMGDSSIKPPEKVIYKKPVTVHKAVQQTAVNHTFPCEAQEIHAGPARLPVPSHISEACNQPEQDRKMDGCQGFSVPWFIGGVEINDHQTEGKNPRKNPAQLSAAAMFDGEKQSDQGQNIEAEVLEIG